MPELAVVNRDMFQNLYWKTPQNYSFASQDALSPLVLFETTKAALHIPIAFSRLENKYLLVAVQGLEPGTNFLVDNHGNWIGGYIPAPYRAFPFSLASAQNGNEVLCFDKASGLDTKNSEEGVPFFGEDGEPSDKTKGVFDFLGHIARNRKPTQVLCDLLQSLDLLEPWPIIINKDGVETNINGLFRIAEIKFNELSAENLINLRDAGGIPLVYCQLLSMQNLSRIAQHASPKIEGNIPNELNFDLSGEEGNISFDGL